MVRRVRSVRPIAAQSGVRSLRTMREIFQPDERNGATLAIYADERNPRLKCRKCNQAKLADTPDPNGKMPAWRSEGADQITPQRIRCIGGSYGLLSHHLSELGNSRTAPPSNGARNCQRAEGRTEAA